jgi:hypothetical protein
MRKVLWLVFAVFVLIATGGARCLSSVDSKPDYVPNETTAIRIAEAVLTPIHGEQKVEAQRPYTVSVPEKDYWLVSGSAPKGQFGGTFAVWIKKQSGCIVNISYTK